MGPLSQGYGIMCMYVCMYVRTYVEWNGMVWYGMVCDPRYCTWDRYGPHNVDRTLITDMCVFIRHPPDHFDVVCAIT